jgi:hypothetical protein
MKFRSSSLFICVLVFFLPMICLAQEPKTKHTNVEFPKAEEYSSTNLEFKIIDGPNQTFGYDIYSNKKLMVHQPSIPAVNGLNGFTTRMAAESIAKLVIQKIKRGEMPPTVTVEELKRLNALK